MRIRDREYRGEEDYQRVRELLIESYAITKRIFNWWLDRWESFRFRLHASEEIANLRTWEQDIHLWETESGKLIGVVNPEKRGDLFLQIHPDYRHIEEEMLNWAEQHHQAIKPEDAASWPLNVFGYEYDKKRASLLKRRGFKDLGLSGYTRRRSLDIPIPDITLPEGYSIRNIHAEDDEDLAKWAVVDNIAFEHTRYTADTVRVRQKAPTYRQDLDLVVVAPDETFASFCIVWFHEVNRLGWFEPVGTHPDHRRRSLAQAVMSEGLRRIKALGATMAYVGSGTDVAANRLYESLDFTDFEKEWHWQKIF